MSEHLYKNPYKGLYTYTEKDSDIFYGRDDAIDKLRRLVYYNKLVTLYGKSGLGKSSLLQAGLFPLLRKNNFIPIYLRLKNFVKEESKPLAQYIVEEVFKEVGKTCEINKNIGDCSDEQVLKELFFGREFVNKDGTKIFPLIVLDQFEDMLIDYPFETSFLMRQLQILLDNNRITPDNYFPENDFRFILVIREDDFFRLEDCIDTHRLTKLKETRFRLKNLNEAEAHNIILEPGKEIFTESDKQQIANKIVEKVKKNDENSELNTAILSLICDQLFHQIYIAKGRKISLDDVESFGNEEIETFYLNATKQFSHSQRKKLEDEILTNTGRRKIADYDDLKSSLGESILKDLLEGEYRILYKIGKKNVELIHDLLAKVIFESRQKREAEEARKKKEAEAEEAQRKATAELKKVRRRNRLVTGALVVASLAILSIILIFNAFSPIVLDGPIENRKIEPNPFREYRIPSGVLHLSKNDTISYNAFIGNPDIHTIRIGDSCSIGYNAFEHCPNLRHLILECRVNNFTDYDGILEKVEEVTLSKRCQYDDYDIYLFLLHENIKKMNIDPNNPNFKRLPDGVIITKSNRKSSYFDWSLLFVPPGIRTIYIPAEYSSIDLQGKDIQVKILREAEVQNGKILNNIDNKSIYKIISKDFIFNKLTKITPDLTHIDLPYATNIGEKAFFMCQELTTVDLPNATYIGEQAFLFCVELSTINLPKATYIGKSAFRGCDSLTTIDLPKATYIGREAFTSCDNLTTIDLPKATYIGKEAFSYCKAITTINIPNATCIEDFAFQDCPNLRKVILHKDVIIGDSVFWNCPNLQIVVIDNDTIPMNIVNEKYGPLTNRVSRRLYRDSNNNLMSYFSVSSNVLYTFQPEHITSFYNRDITLYVPYNQADNHYYLRPHFKEVREMSIWQMLYLTSTQIFDGFNNSNLHIWLLGLIAIIIVGASILNKSIRSRWKDTILYLALLLCLTLTGFVIALLCYIYNNIELGFILPCSIIITNLLYLFIYRKKYYLYIKRYKKGLIWYGAGISLILWIIIFAFDYLGINSLSLRTTYNYTMLLIVCFIEYISSFVNALISVPLLCIPFIILALPIYHELQESRRRRSLKKRLS